MKITQALIVGAAALLQLSDLGDFGTVQAATCADPAFTCVGDTVAKDPIPTDDCAATSCVNPECCDPDYDNCPDHDEYDFGNGRCTLEYNVEACGFDGGDCCECDCDISDAMLYFECGSAGYACVDPYSTCVDDDDYVEGACGDHDKRGDSRCDLENNVEGCGFDGGDCCECDCEAPDAWDNCGEAGYACIDPNSACVGDDDFIEGACGDRDSLKDGKCDLENNIEGCGFDGGDCCECDCDENAFYDCGVFGFACLDPNSACVDDDDYIAGACGDHDRRGDGRCDMENNVEGCGFDGGDCCECDCDDGMYSCEDWAFACVDPNSACVNDDDYIVGGCADFDKKGDGKCDLDNNVENCAFDGGDCCECDCLDDDWFNFCGTTGYACIDPKSTCVNDDDYSLDFDGATADHDVIPKVVGLVLVTVLGMHLMLKG